MKSEKRPTKQKVVSFGTVALTLGVAGCSYLAPQPDPAGDSKSFRATATTNSLPAPLPVDIADDIKRIANGQLVESSGAWRQATGEAQETEGGFEPTAGAAPPNAPIRYRARRPATQGSDSADAPTAGHVSRPGSGKPGTYVVKPGDTLMKISFEKYGDLYRWREILEANKGKVKNYSSLPVGMSLTINDVEYVVIERDGQPYLIRKNDTLAKISVSVYGKTSFWKNLWHNNPTLIRDPNKIYAGFTLYYRDRDQLGEVHMSQALPEKNPGTKPAAPRAEKAASAPLPKAPLAVVAPSKPAAPQVLPPTAAPNPASEERVPAASEGWSNKSSLPEDPLKESTLPPPETLPEKLSDPAVSEAPAATAPLAK